MVCRWYKYVQVLVCLRAKRRGRPCNGRALPAAGLQLLILTLAIFASVCFGFGRISYIRLVLRLV